MPTLGNIIDQFKATYRLSDFDIHHDAVHAMTGFGIGGINEMRVNAVIEGMHGQTLDAAYRSSAETLSFIREYYAGIDNALAGETPLTSSKFRLAFCHTAALQKSEIAELHDMGRYIGKSMRILTDKSFFDLSEQELRALDFTVTNWRSYAQDIRDRNETPKNRRVERMAINALSQEAQRQGTAYSIPPYTAHKVRFP